MIGSENNIFTNSEAAFEVSLTSPLPQIVYDETDIQNTIRNLKLIPKFQTTDRTSLKYLQLIQSICNSSGTHTGCLGAIQRFAFEGLLDAQYNERPGFISVQREISASDRTQFENAADNIGLNFSQIQTVTKLTDKNYIESGDGYIYCRLQKILGLWRVSFSAINYTDLMFFAEGDKDNSGKAITAIWAKSWNDKQLKAKKYRMVNVTTVGSVLPNWSDHHKEKVLETVFHVKNGDETDLFGDLTCRPILKALFNESQKDDFLVKADATDTVSKYIFATPAPPNGVDAEILAENRKREAEAMRKLTNANANKPESLIKHSFYGADGEPHLFNLEVFRDINWFLGTDERNAKKIQIFHGIGDDIYGAEQTKAGFSAEAIIYSLSKANESVIKPRQQAWAANWSYIFNILGKVTGQNILSETTIKFESRIDKMLDKLEQLRNSKSFNQDV